MDEFVTNIRSHSRTPSRIKTVCGSIKSGNRLFEQDEECESPHYLKDALGEIPMPVREKKTDSSKWSNRKSDVSLKKNDKSSDKAPFDISSSAKQEKKTEQIHPVEPEPKSLPAALQYMQEEIQKYVTLIFHNECLYYYTGKTYRVLQDDADLLRLVRSKVSPTAFGSSSVKKFDDLVRYMKADPNLIPEDYVKRIRKARYYVSLKNGVLDLQTMRLLPHSREYLTFYSLDAEWREHPNPRRFKEFLRTASGEEQEIMLRMSEAIGYMISPINEGKYFFVMGTASNSGKSTLGELLRKLLGEKLVSSRSPQQVSGRFALGDIHGKILNLSMDLPNGKLNPVTVSLIKQITGGDAIAIEQKYEKIQEVRSNMRFLFASNYPVTVPQEDDEDGFWDRMVILPFQYSVEKKDEDPYLLDKLLKEKDDIVSYCLLALGKILQNHLIFSECHAADEMKMNWRYCTYDSTGTIRSFVQNYLECSGDSGDRIGSMDLYEKYFKVCTENGEKGVSYNDFQKWLCSNLEGCKKRRIRQGSDNPRSCLTGIRWKI